MARDIFSEFMDRIGVNVSWDVVDEVVVSDPNTLRPVKGHAFESLLDEIAHKHLKCQIRPGPGGDTDIDRFLTNNSGNQFSLQIKTCATSTVRAGSQFGVNIRVNRLGVIFNNHRQRV